MQVTDYTTYADIRAALGQRSVELTDDTLALEMYASNLYNELSDVNPNVRAKYAEVSLITADLRTDVQTQFYQTTRLFALYAIAKQALSSLPMSAPKDVSDNKATISRFSDGPYKETAKRIENAYEVNRARLSASYISLTAGNARTPRTFILTSSPSTDPVVE